jgi:uncharacterized UPF0160 family protein
MKIVTHSGNFHTDDVFAVATLLFVYPDAEVIRSRDEQVISSADIVVDVGGVYDPSKLRFDHHQTGGALTRDNTIPYASFGLVWKEYGEQVSGSNEVMQEIERKLVLPIDAIDNAVSVAVPVFEGIREYAIGDFFSSYKTTKDTEEDLYKTFIVEEIYQKSTDKRVIDVSSFDFKFGAFGPVLLKHPEPIYVIHQHSADRFAVRALPIDINIFETKKPFPESWRSRKGSDFELASGVKGAHFAHKSGYLVVANSKEAALELANKSLNA